MRITICKGCTCFILSLSLFFSACTLGPEFIEPTPPVPESYRAKNFSEAPTDELKWWELFEDPVLYSLVTTALENNYDLKIAASRLEQARANYGFVRADQYPRVDIDAGASTGNFSGGTRSEDTNSTVYLAAPVSWEIDFWGKFSRSTESARAELMASEYGLKAIQLSLIAEVVTTYHQLLDFHRRLRISSETLASRVASLNIIEQRFDKGIIAELDVNQAQIQKEIAAAAIPSYKRSIAKAENTLSILLGRLPQAIPQPESMTDEFRAPEIPVGLPPDLVERRPDIRQAMYVLKAETANIGVAEALRWPAISLTGSLGVASTELGSLTIEGGVWSAGGRMLGPLIDFQKNKRRVEIQEELARQALFQFEKIVLTAFKEVEDALLEITTYRDELEAVNRQLKASQNARNLSKERYDKGVTSYLEVLDTERTLFSTDLQQSELMQQYLNAYVRLYKALGGGWTSKEELEGNTSGTNLSNEQ